MRLRTAAFTVAVVLIFVAPPLLKPGALLRFRLPVQRTRPDRLEDPAGDNGHWKVIDGSSTTMRAAKPSRSTSGRKKNTRTLSPARMAAERHAVHLQERPDPSPRRQRKTRCGGKPIPLSFPDADSGVLMRGQTQSQVNIWAWPAGRASSGACAETPSCPLRSARRPRPP